MRVLLISHSFNSLTQRFWVEIARLGHELSMELDINDPVTIEAVELFQPDIIIAPYLKRAIPEAVWGRYRCIIIHPGIVGDRGPSALDWAILNGEEEWGVTALQAAAEMDAGDIWAESRFAMRAVRKSTLYHNEVTEAAVETLHRVLDACEEPAFTATPLDCTAPHIKGQWNDGMRQEDRRIDWQRESTSEVMAKLRCADGFPGVLDTLYGQPYYLFDAKPEAQLKGPPGDVIAKRDNAICRATTDGAVWIGCLKEKGGFKLPACQVLGNLLDDVPERGISIEQGVVANTYQDIAYEERNGVGYLYFDFYNGAMSTQRCQRLTEAFRYASGRDVNVLVLMGGEDFWSNGIDLNSIEAATSPPDESWANINAMDDLCQAMIETTDKLLVAAIRGNAAAGGLFMALAADYIFAREGVVLNPHYKNMGNLYGSEYWSYLLPKRVGKEGVKKVMGERLPLGAVEAVSFGLIDDCFGDSLAAFQQQLFERVEALSTQAELGTWIEQKRQRRTDDEAAKPLAQYREEELARMRMNFYGFDPSYHVARHEFVHKNLAAHTPLHLARHRVRTRLAESD